MMRYNYEKYLDMVSYDMVSYTDKITSTINNIKIRTVKEQYN